MSDNTTYDWTNGAEFYVGVNATTQALAALANKTFLTQEETRAYYREQAKPAWAPPAWAFAPAWTFNNIMQIRSGLEVLNSDPRNPARTPALIAQGAAWLGFISWMPGSLSARSPKLSAGITLFTTAASVASVVTASRISKRAALGYVPIAVWGLYASALALWIATHNEDPVIG